MTGPERRRPDAEAAPHSTDTVDLEERKERMLHTRVPSSLDRYLRRRARSLGLSVSTVVRNVLLNTFGLVEDIVTDSANIARALTQREAIRPGDGAGTRAPSEAAGRPAASEILAWQDAVLNLNAVCDRCNRVLRKGTRAAIGVRECAGPCAILCRKCLGKVAGQAVDRDARAVKRR